MAVQETPSNPKKFFQEKEEETKLEKNEIKTLLACGLDPARVGTRIGRGWNSKVYHYSLPDTSDEWVVKIPSRLPLSIRESVDEEKRNTDLVKRYFAGFTPESILKSDESGENFCLLMRYIKGEPLSKENLNTEGVKEQFEQILEKNKQLVKEQKASLDFVGVFEFVKRKLPDRLQIGPVALPNLIVEKVIVENNKGECKIWIVDTDLLYFGTEKVEKKQQLRDRLVAIISYALNKRYIYEHFGLKM